METKMRISDQGIANLIEWEGYQTHKYRDSAGLWTIGVGHLLTKSELTSGKLLIKASGVKVEYDQGIDEDTVSALLRQDLNAVEDVVSECVRVELEQHQYDVLVSFTFNVGGQAFATSSLLKCINSGYLSGVPYQLERWNMSGGRRIRGLTNRRLKEVEVWEVGYV